MLLDSTTRAKRGRATFLKTFRFSAKNFTTQLNLETQGESRHDQDGELLLQVMGFPEAEGCSKLLRMITYIPKNSYKAMPWKNGKGTTEQIAIGPDKASFPDDFVWRISSATVNSNDPFSKFVGCDRLLMVTKGEGLSLNGSKLHPLEVISFAGETAIQAELIEGPIVDLGVIYRRDKVRVTMAVLNLSEVSTLILQAGIHFIYCLRGRVTVKGIVVHAQDSIRIENTSSLELEGLNHSAYVLITIEEK